MLREIRHVRQIPDEDSRRWFTDDYWDLYVWHREGRFVGFQLTYDKDHLERAFTWIDGQRPNLSTVDSGRNPVTGASGRKTPILRNDQGSLPPEVITKFRADSTEIDSAVRDFVLGRLLVYLAEDAR